MKTVRFRLIAIALSTLVWVLALSAAAPLHSEAPALSRFINYLVEEGVFTLAECEQILQQGDLCFVNTLMNAARFSEELDKALSVFHGTGLSRADWVSGNGVWSTRIFSPLELRNLEMYISEKEVLGGISINGMIVIR